MSRDMLAQQQVDVMTRFRRVQNAPAGAAAAAAAATAAAADAAGALEHPITNLGSGFKLVIRGQRAATESTITPKAASEMKRIAALRRRSMRTSCDMLPEVSAQRRLPGNLYNRHTRDGSEKIASAHNKYARQFSAGAENAASELQPNAPVDSLLPDGQTAAKSDLAAVTTTSGQMSSHANGGMGNKTILRRVRSESMTDNDTRRIISVAKPAEKLSAKIRNERHSFGGSSSSSSSLLPLKTEKPIPQSPIRRPMPKVTDTNNGTRIKGESKITNRPPNRIAKLSADSDEDSGSGSGSDTPGQGQRLPSIKRGAAAGAEAAGDETPAPRKKPIDNTKYRYKFFHGNNGRVILQAFRKRTWMHPASTNKNNEMSEKETNSRPNSKASNKYSKAKGAQVKDDIKDVDVVGAGEEKKPLPPVDFELIWEMYRSPKRYKTSVYKDCVLNHIQHNNVLVTKKGLFFSIRDYCIQENLDQHSIIPRTYFMSSSKDGREDDKNAFFEYNAKCLVSMGQEQEQENALASAVATRLSVGTKDGLLWICKPASLTNRGYGIKLLRGVDAVMKYVKRANSRPSSPENNTAAATTAATGDDTESPLDIFREGGEKEGQVPDNAALTKAASRRGAQEGWIVQEYIERPLLVAGRKFDIRVFVLLHLDKTPGKWPGMKYKSTVKTPAKELQAYIYEEPYVRTSWKPYTLDDISDRECHLTNDAIQKKAEGYGLFEEGNKLTLDGWQTSIIRDYPKAPPNVVRGQIWPKIKELTKLSVIAGLHKLEKTTINKSFELLGYDYMVTDAFEPLLIEVNSNPCLELSCPLLGRLIPEIVNAMFKTSVDKLCPPPPEGQRTKACETSVTSIDAERNQFEQLKLR